jgi:membrane associated rhomboid family serine protease/tetratricopeptide (TPR) repeat protein
MTPEPKPLTPPQRFIPWLTLVLIAANCAVEATLVVRYGPLVLKGAPDPVQPGVLNGLQLWVDHEWWRALTAMFLHQGAIHLFFNMWALWNVGAFTEWLFGRRFMLFAYFLTGLAGSFMSTLAHPGVNGLGASGAIFGLFGLICGFALRAREMVPPEAFERLRAGILLSLGLNVAISLAIPQIDVAAHLGGLLAGTGAGLLATASAIEQPNKRPVLSSQLLVIAAVLAVALISRTHAVHSSEGRSWERNRLAKKAIDTERWADAIAAADHALTLKEDRNSHLLRAEALAKLGRWPEALVDLTTAQEQTSLDDDHLPEILLDKANAELRVGKTEEAKSDLARSTDLAGGSAEWLNAAGQRSVLRGDYELAVLTLRAAHKRMPEEPEPANAYAWALVLSEGDMKEALAAADLAVDKASLWERVWQPTLKSEVFGTRCWVHALRDDKESALADCQTAIASGSKHVDQGMLAYLKGDFKEAMQQWEHAGEDTPFAQHEMQREMAPWIERAKSKL